jgi:hypothetical protein
MRRLFADKEHLLRMALVFVAGIAVFIVARALFVPKDFGVYGHFRAGALDDSRGLALSYAGRKACEDCHADIVEARIGSKHQRIGCESCHGPLAKHVGDPEANKPERPDAKSICLLCHLQNVAKPAAFPQVDPKDHGDGAPCSSCHKPHHPEIDAAPAAHKPAAAEVKR